MLPIGAASAYAEEKSVADRVSKALESTGSEADEEVAATITRDEAVNISTDLPRVSFGADGGVATLSLIGASPDEVVGGRDSRSFGNVASSADSIVRTVDGGAQILYVMNGPAAPKSQEYELELPPGAVSKATEDGGFTLVDEAGEEFGAIEKPWARDATGRELPTRYELNGSKLVQTTDTSGAVYPVVADPKLTFGWGVYLNLWGHEARAAAAAIVAAGGVATVATCAATDRLPGILKRIATIACASGGVTLPKIWNKLKEIKASKDFQTGACYQVKILPKVANNFKTVNAKNCR